jgi:CheY-like chemotaxis protein
MPLILLVDDDDDVRGAFSSALRRRGYEVAEAINGLDALELLDGGLRPTLILLDSDMPVLDGAGFRHAQLINPALANIPVLLVTGDQEIEDLADALRPIGVVQKPIGFHQFLSTVELVLQRVGATAPVAHAS